MAYRNNDGCGCILALIIVMVIISGIRSCTEHLIKGDLELPKFGSGHVSGGSGGYGTSNGYNVKYKHTTSPNSNSSLRDYTHTNNQPTEYSNGRIEQSSSNPTHLQSQRKSNTSTQSPVQSNSSTNIVQQISDYEKQFTTCSVCKGKGYVHKSWTFTGESGFPCIICGKSEKHKHEEQRCYECMGRGKVRSNSSTNIDQLISDYEKQFTTCSECKGKGYVLKSWTFTGESGFPCVICGKSERHEHKEQRCYECMGSGKVRIE